MGGHSTGIHGPTAGLPRSRTHIFLCLHFAPTLSPYLRMGDVKCTYAASSELACPSRPHTSHHKSAPTPHFPHIIFTPADRRRKLNVRRQTQACMPLTPSHPPLSIPTDGQRELRIRRQPSSRVFLTLTPPSLPYFHNFPRFLHSIPADGRCELHVRRQP